jgi:hypothetical protein
MPLDRKTQVANIKKSSGFMEVMGNQAQMKPGKAARKFSEMFLHCTNAMCSYSFL